MVLHFEIPEAEDAGQNVEAELSETAANEGSGESGSSLAGFDPDLEEEFLDLAVDDLL